MPIYYFPAADVRMDLLHALGPGAGLPPQGCRPVLSTCAAGSSRAANAAWIHDAPTSAVAQGLSGMVAFYWKKMDRWFEEDDEVYVHPRDPYHRVDVLNSSRHVQVIVQGEVVAESRRPRLLFETRLPTRFYLPWQDVRADLLMPSTTSSQCPYKGVASYYSVRVGDKVVKDLAWVYQYPIPECPKIENLVCFYNEQVDAILVDGVEEPRPVTAWSKAPQILTISDPQATERAARTPPVRTGQDRKAPGPIPSPAALGHLPRCPRAVRPRRARRQHPAGVRGELQEHVGPLDRDR